jgi:uncharacterized protein YjbI with pentapeptide repeats
MRTRGRDRLNGLPPSANVKRESFSGMSLAGLRLDDVWFDRCDFSDADLRLATLDGCHFRFCDFSRANLAGAAVRKATFSGCNFTDANLTNCDFTGSKLTFVNTGAPNGLTIMTGALTKGAILTDVKAERVVGWHRE